MRRGIRLFLWFFKAFGKKYFKIIILGLILGISVFFFYPRFERFLPKPKKTIKVGLIGRYTMDSLPLSILGKLSRGLVKINLDGSASPDLAEKWEVKEEGKVYLFYLKEGVFWNDGAPLKAEDIHYNLKEVEVKAKDDKTLELRLQEPFSPFPVILNQPVFKKGLLGVGKYKVTSIKSSGKFIQSIKLESEDAHLVYKFYPTEKAAILGFKLGEIDELVNISNLSDLENWPQIRIVPKICQGQFVAIFYNTKGGQLSQKTLRQALTYALVKPEDKSRTLGPLNPNSWAYNSQTKPYHRDIQKAKKLLGESKLQEVNIELTSTFSQLSSAEKIKKSWEELGVKTTIRVVSTLPENFQAFLVSQKIPSDPDQYTLWHSTQNTNITGYNNPKVDKLLEDARKIPDQEERKVKYLDFQRFLVEDAPAAFLFHPTVYTISRLDKVENQVCL